MTQFPPLKLATNIAHFQKYYVPKSGHENTGKHRVVQLPASVNQRFPRDPKTQILFLRI